MFQLFDFPKSRFKLAQSHKHSDMPRDAKGVVKINGHCDKYCA